MKKEHKRQIRLFLMNRLYNGGGDLRQDLYDVLDAHDIDHFEGLEFAEAQINRIDKLFNFPAIDY